MIRHFPVYTQIGSPTSNRARWQQRDGSTRNNQQVYPYFNRIFNTTHLYDSIRKKIFILPHFSLLEAVPLNTFLLFPAVCESVFLCCFSTTVLIGSVRVHERQHSTQITNLYDVKQVYRFFIYSVKCHAERSPHFWNPASTSAAVGHDPSVRPGWWSGVGGLTGAVHL